MRRPTKSVSYRLAEPVVRVVLRLVTRHDWRGGEHLAVGRGFVVVANHVSHADPLTLAHFLVNHGVLPRFLGKESVFRVPVVGPLLRRAGQIPVYRQSRDASKAYAAAVEAVRAGEAVVIYPEGTLTRDPDLWPMRGKSGAARIARETGCALVPVVQWGPQDLLRPYGRVPHLVPPPCVTVVAGPRLEIAWPAAGATPAEELAAVERATETVMAELTRMLAEVRGVPAPNARWDPEDHGEPVTGNPAARWRR